MRWPLYIGIPHMGKPFHKKALRGNFSTWGGHCIMFLHAGKVLHKESTCEEALRNDFICRPAITYCSFLYNVLLSYCDMDDNL